ncbi:MAG: large conductance mechanosensitive channel protein MscL [Anaerolineae bacterium]|nr:large conductance mechanosensitive channel protein MscL [Anaerolineae bacterium]
MLKEFREFIMRGNVMDLAVAVVIGAAFTAVVNSFVQDVIMPILGLFTGGIDFGNLYLNLSGRSYETYAAAKEAGAAVIGYGAFIQSIISFLIIGFAIFLIVKAINRVYKKQEAAPAGPTVDQQLLTEIRDLLAKQNR